MADILLSRCPKGVLGVLGAGEEPDLRDPVALDPHHVDAVLREFDVVAPCREVDGNRDHVTVDHGRAGHRELERARADGHRRAEHAFDGGAAPMSAGEPVVAGLVPHDALGEQAGDRGEVLRGHRVEVLAGNGERGGRVHCEHLLGEFVLVEPDTHHR
nr:hypothetical protein [Saccharothrix sp. ALI-22-I]